MRPSYVGAASEGGCQINPTNRPAHVLPSPEASPPAVRAPSQAPSARPAVVWRAKVVPLQRPPAAPVKRPRISVVIPALNEAKNLEHVLPALPEGLFEVILVDGASVDATVATARRLRPDVRLVRQTRSGKGNALACGFAASRGDIIVMLDADGSADPGEIPRFVETLLGGADFAKGSRRLEGGGSADITRMPVPGQPLPELPGQPPLRERLHRPLLRLQRLLGGPVFRLWASTGDHHRPPERTGASGATASRSRRSSTCGSRGPASGWSRCRATSCPACTGSAT